MGEIEKYLLNLIIKEKKILITGIFAGLIFFLIYFFFFYTSLYTSTTNLYIKNIQKPSIVTSLPDSNSILRSESGYSNPLFNLYELIKAENVAFNVYDRIKDEYAKDLTKLGVVSKESFFDAFVMLVSSEVIPSTDVLVVSLKWPNRVNSQNVLNIIIEEFRDENLRIRRSLDSEKSIYLEEQTKVIEEQLEILREEVKNYKVKNNLSDADTEVYNLVNARIGLLREISVLKAQVDYNARKFKELAKQLNIDDPIIALKAAGVGNDTYLIELSKELALAQQNLAILKTKFTDKYHKVVELKNQIEELKEQIENRKVETVQNVELPRSIYDGPSTNIVAQFAMVHVERLSQLEMIKTLEKGMKDILEEEKILHEKQIGLGNLTKQEEAFAAAYQNIKAKQLEARIKENEIVDNIITLKSPTKAALIQIGLITKFFGFILFGALVGLGIAYIKQGIEDKWEGVDELKRITGHDILGVIPWLKDGSSEHAEKIYDAAYTNIASALVTKAFQEDVSVLSFISTNLYQNRSVIINNISGLLSSLEKPSIIIDFSGDVRLTTDISEVVNFINQQLKKTEYKNLKVAVGSSLQDLELNGSKKENDSIFDEFYDKYNNEIRDMLKNAIAAKDVVIDGNTHQVYFLGFSAARNKLNLKYLVSTKGFSVLLKCLKREFDFVFINTPHGNFMLPEINFIKKNSEAVVVIAAMDSNREGLIKLVNNITESGQKILGVISREKDTELEKFYNNGPNSEFIGDIEEEV